MPQLEKRYVFRRLTLVAALSICGWTTYQMFKDITDISGPSATAYGIATGLLGVAIGMYFKERGGS